MTQDCSSWTLADLHRVLDEVLNKKIDPISAQLVELTIRVGNGTAELKEEINNLGGRVQRIEHTMYEEHRDFRASVANIEARAEEQAAVALDLETELGKVKGTVKNLSETVESLQAELQKTKRKCIDLEDRSRRNNLRLINLPEGEEGDDAAAFLQARLHRWFPSLNGMKAEVDRAHRVRSDKGKEKGRPRTLLFRLLRWQDWNAIMKDLKTRDFQLPVHKGERLRFFPDHSPETSDIRRAFAGVMKIAYQKGLRPTLLHPARLRLRPQNGPARIFENLVRAEAYVNSQPSAQVQLVPDSHSSSAKKRLFDPRSPARSKIPRRAFPSPETQHSQVPPQATPAHPAPVPAKLPNNGSPNFTTEPVEMDLSTITTGSCVVIPVTATEEQTVTAPLPAVTGGPELAGASSSVTESTPLPPGETEEEMTVLATV